MTLRVSILIPVYNEARTLETLIEKVRAVPVDKEIVCVNDCSNDGSREILDRLLAEGRVDKVRHHEVKPFAHNAGTILSGACTPLGKSGLGCVYRKLRIVHSAIRNIGQ